MRRLIWLTLAAVLVLSAAQTATQAQEDTGRETITIPISLYVVVDDVDNPDPALSSRRTPDELREILDGVNDIWRQADIRFEAQYIGMLALPESVLRDINGGSFRAFFQQAGNTFEVPDLGLINGFYAREIGGPNGIMPFGAPLFFVMDEPTVFDRRVSSHEIGHILGLHHTQFDSGRLLYSGTNGMALTEEEIIVARYVAQGMLDGLR